MGCTRTTGWTLTGKRTKRKNRVWVKSSSGHLGFYPRTSLERVHLGLSRRGTTLEPSTLEPSTHYSVRVVTDDHFVRGRRHEGQPDYSGETLGAPENTCSHSTSRRVSPSLRIRGSSSDVDPTLWTPVQGEGGRTRVGRLDRPLWTGVHLPV